MTVRVGPQFDRDGATGLRSVSLLLSSEFYASAKYVCPGDRACSAVVERPSAIQPEYRTESYEPTVTRIYMMSDNIWYSRGEERVRIHCGGVW